MNLGGVFCANLRACNNEIALNDARLTQGFAAGPTDANRLNSSMIKTFHRMETPNV
jgi:hypothetical protein